MSRRRKVWPTCPVTGKVRHRSRWAAQQALDEILRKANPKHTEQRAYPCPHCGGGHLTSQARP